MKDFLKIDMLFGEYVLYLFFLLVLVKVGCFLFVYNMFGCIVNKLLLYVEGLGFGREVLWLKEGN